MATHLFILHMAGLFCLSSGKFADFGMFRWAGRGCLREFRFNGDHWWPIDLAWGSDTYLFMDGSRRQKGYMSALNGLDLLLGCWALVKMGPVRSSNCPYCITLNIYIYIFSHLFLSTGFSFSLYHVMQHFFCGKDNLESTGLFFFFIYGAECSV